LICDICKKHKATVFIKKTVNGKKVEYNLCETCAGKVSGPSNNTSVFSQNLFSGLSDMIAGFSDSEKTGEIEGALVCSKCSMTFGDFQLSGRFGCDKCYDVFAVNLTPLMKRLQGSVQHAGKSPPGTEKDTEINKLKKELESAVKKEEYERAAIIRDKLKELEGDN